MKTFWAFLAFFTSLAYAQMDEHLYHCQNEHQFGLDVYRMEDPKGFTVKWRNPRYGRSQEVNFWGVKVRIDSRKRLKLNSFSLGEPLDARMELNLDRTTGEAKFSFHQPKSLNINDNWIPEIEDRYSIETDMKCTKVN